MHSQWKKTNLFTLVEEAQSSLTRGECPFLYLLPSGGQLLPLLLKVLTGTKKYIWNFWKTPCVRKCRWERTTIMHIFDAYNSTSRIFRYKKRERASWGETFLNFGLHQTRRPCAVYSCSIQMQIRSWSLHLRISYLHLFTVQNESTGVLIRIDIWYKYWDPKTLYTIFLWV